MKTLFDSDVYRRSGDETCSLRWRIEGDKTEVSLDSGKTWRPHNETPDQLRRSFAKGYIIYEDAV
jgi:hypothetical protein